MTTTSRLGMTLPDVLDNMSLGDNILSDAYDKIDANCHCVVATTLGSITSPFEGMHVYNQADGKNYIRKNGSFQQIVGQGTAPSSGVVGYKTKATISTETLVQSPDLWVKLASTSFNAISGNKYLIRTSISEEPEINSSSEEYEVNTCVGPTNSNADPVYGILYGFNASMRTFPTNVVAMYTASTTGLLYASINARTLSPNGAKFCVDGTFANVVVYDVTEVA